MKAKKSLGQNFLNSKKILGDIVRAGEVKEGDIVLEVGPGKGALTQTLLNAGARVIAVEKDSELIKNLREKFYSEIKNGKLLAVEEDILKINLKDYKLKNSGYKVVANIPYYITGELIRFFLENKIQPSLMTLLVQKEVADRIIARPNSHSSRASDKKESLLSISVKVYGEPKYFGKVPARYFSPKPKVDSGIISIKNIKSPFKNEKERSLFFKIVRLGFSHKRKILVSNLSKFFPKEKILNVFKELKIDEKSRAENLDIESWKQVGKKL